jgi:hypothetical protein
MEKAQLCFGDVSRNFMFQVKTCIRSLMLRYKGGNLRTKFSGNLTYNTSLKLVEILMGKCENSRF